MYDKTMTFSVNDEKEIEMKKTLMLVYDALTKKGYNPVNQIVGYILSEDPTYITTYNNARSLIRHIDRDELLQALVKSYLHPVSCPLRQYRTKSVWQLCTPSACKFPFRACFVSSRTHLACIFSEIFRENTENRQRIFSVFPFISQKI